MVKPPLWRRAYWSAYLLWHYRQQPPLPYLPREQLCARRDANVRRMVAYAYRWVPHYRETMDRLGLAPADFRAADDLRRLPMITIADLQRDPARYRSTQFSDDDLLRVGSGGSSGAPHYIWHDTAALLQSAAHARRDAAASRNLIGRPGGHRTVSLSSPHGTGVQVRAFTRKKALYPPREPVQRMILSVGDPPEINLPKINAFEPDVITGYGSYFGRLFDYARQSGQSLHRPAVIVYASEAMPLAVRRMIVEEYGIPVFSLYQTIEAFKLGFECEAHRGYHINSDHYVVRIVASDGHAIDADGADLPAGETGEALLSNLVNRGMVLLNMRVGDMLRWLPAGCSCGRTLPLVDFVQGRAQEWIRLPNGTLLHPQTVTAALYEVGGMQRFQVVQRTPTDFEVRLVVSDQVDKEALAARVRQTLEDRVGGGATFVVNYVDEPITTAGGKMLGVIGLGGDGVGGRLD